MLSHLRIARDQHVQAGRVLERDFPQLDEVPRQDGQTVAPAIVNPEGVDGDGGEFSHAGGKCRPV